ncbi:MAG: hypothetical protein HKL80_05600 [Acidimicrobiales bacterium]|nr:hypothetical protein [Acidimicrobiales bacterium]
MTLTTPTTYKNEPLQIASRIQPGRRNEMRPEEFLPKILDQLDSTYFPSWSFSTWYNILCYPDLNDYAKMRTKKLGRARDQIISQREVLNLVEWAGSKRTRSPIASVAGALVALQEIRENSSGRVDLEESMSLLTAAVISAKPPRVLPPRKRRTHLNRDPDLVVGLGDGEAVTENSKLAPTVEKLLHISGAPRDSTLQKRAENSVVQCGDWWIKHPGPTEYLDDLPALPGVIPASRLKEAERLTTHLTDTELMGLVAGPRPGTKRPCQLAWQRGLTFWVAVELASSKEVSIPTDTIRWWRSQVSLLNHTSDETIDLSLYPIENSPK